MIGVTLKGYLGNHLFQYAACRSLAETKNLDFSVPGHFLGNILLNLNCKLGSGYAQCDKVFDEVSNTIFHEDFYNIGKNTLLNGFFQSEKYFRNHKNDVKNWFKQPPPSGADDFLSNHSDFCFIHFRGDDYVNTPYFLPKSYFENAKVEMRINPNMKIIVLTGIPTRDLKSQNFSYNQSLIEDFFPDDIILVNSVDFDFYCLSHARYLILSNSSFSWWGAYLNDNSEKIIGPTNWLNFNNKIGVGFVPAESQLDKIFYIR